MIGLRKRDLRVKGKATFTATVLIALLLVALIPFSSAAAPELYLAVILSPTRLPADGGTYSSVTIQLRNGTGFPVPAPADIQVTLTSSSTEAGNVESPITIRRGSTFTTAKFTSTRTPGQTLITATSSGFNPDSRNVVTVEPSGTPRSLKVNLAPAQVLTEPGTTGLIVVQLLDAAGQPSRAASDIRVAISSSLPSIGITDPAITIKSGSTLGIANYYTFFAVGETTVTTSAPGFSSSSAPLKVVGPIPIRLTAYPSPRVFPAYEGSSSLVIIQLQDINGLPAKAPSNITVTLAAQQDSPVFLERRSVIIPTGHTYTTAKLFGSLEGASQITASAQGYESAITEVRTAKRSSAETGRLAVILAPPQLPARAEGLVIVQLQDEADNPLVAFRDIEVTLTSSSTGVGTVDGTVKVLKGQSYAIAKFRSGFVSGASTITASATNFQSSSATITVVEPKPIKLALRVASNRLPADGATYLSVLVELLDAAGLPAKAPTNVTVAVSSSRTDIGVTPEILTIREGATSAITNLTTTLIPGSTVLTASATGFSAAAPFTLQTVKPSPSQLTIFIVPQIMHAIPAPLDAVVVQLQDSSGIPATARSDITIFLSSSAPGVADVDPVLRLRAGTTFATGQLRTSDIQGRANITVTASGFSGSTASVHTFLTPMIVNITSSILSPNKELMVDAFTPAKVTVTASSGGNPITEGSVSWEASIPAIQNETNDLSKEGTATATYVPSKAGNATLKATVRAIGFIVASASLPVSVNPVEFDAELVAEKEEVQAGDPVILKVTANKGADPLVNAGLRWHASAGTLTRPPAITDATGTASAIFFSNNPERINITVTITKDGYIPTTRSLGLTVTPTVIITPPTDGTSGGIDSITGIRVDFITLAVLLAGVGGGEAAVFMLLSRRRRKRLSGGEEEKGEYV